MSDIVVAESLQGCMLREERQLLEVQWPLATRGSYARRNGDLMMCLERQKSSRSSQRGVCVISSFLSLWPLHIYSKYGASAVTQSGTHDVFTPLELVLSMFAMRFRMLKRGGRFRYSHMPSYVPHHAKITAMFHVSQCFQWRSCTNEWWRVRAYTEGCHSMCIARELQRLSMSV